MSQKILDLKNDVQASCLPEEIKDKIISTLNNNPLLENLKNINFSKKEIIQKNLIALSNCIVSLDQKLLLDNKPLTSTPLPSNQKKILKKIKKNLQSIQQSIWDQIFSTNHVDLFEDALALLVAYNPKYFNQNISKIPLDPLRNIVSNCIPKLDSITMDRIYKKNYMRTILSHINVLQNSLDSEILEETIKNISLHTLKYLSKYTALYKLKKIFEILNQSRSENFSSELIESSNLLSSALSKGHMHTAQLLLQVAEDQKLNIKLNLALDIDKSRTPLTLAMTAIIEKKAKRDQTSLNVIKRLIELSGADQANNVELNKAYKEAYNVIERLINLSGTDQANNVELNKAYLDLIIKQDFILSLLPKHPSQVTSWMKTADLTGWKDNEFNALLDGVVRSSIENKPNFILSLLPKHLSQVPSWMVQTEYLKDWSPEVFKPLLDGVMTSSIEKENKPAFILHLLPKHPSQVTSWMKTADLTGWKDNEFNALLDGVARSSIENKPSSFILSLLPKYLSQVTSWMESADLTGWKDNEFNALLDGVVRSSIENKPNFILSLLPKHLSQVPSWMVQTEYLKDWSPEVFKPLLDGVMTSSIEKENKPAFILHLLPKHPSQVTSWMKTADLTGWKDNEFNALLDGVVRSSIENKPNFILSLLPKHLSQVPSWMVQTEYLKDWSPEVFKPLLDGVMTSSIENKPSSFILSLLPKYLSQVTSWMESADLTGWENNEFNALLDGVVRSSIEKTTKDTLILSLLQRNISQINSWIRNKALNDLGQDEFNALLDGVMRFETEVENKQRILLNLFLTYVNQVTYWIKKQTTACLQSNGLETLFKIITDSSILHKENLISSFLSKDNALDSDTQNSSKALFNALLDHVIQYSDIENKPAFILSLLPKRIISQVLPWMESSQALKDWNSEEWNTLFKKVKSNPDLDSSVTAPCFKNALLKKLEELQINAQNSELSKSIAKVAETYAELSKNPSAINKGKGCFAFLLKWFAPSRDKKALLNGLNALLSSSSDHLSQTLQNNRRLFKNNGRVNGTGPLFYELRRVLCK